MEKEKCIHEGHRLRLLDTVFEAGIDKVSDIQAVEFMLFYVFPRGDVNPLAHRLLDAFGNFGNIIDADLNDLKSVKGIGDRSAKMIKMFGEMFFYYTQSKRSPKECLKDYTAIADFVEDSLRFKSSEEFHIIALDSSFKFIVQKCLAKGSVLNVGINPLTIANFISSTKPAFVMLAHCHPGGSAKPSKLDIQGTERVRSLVQTLGVKFLDHVVLGADGIYSIGSEGFIRVFEDKLKGNFLEVLLRKQA